MTLVQTRSTERRFFRLNLNWDKRLLADSFTKQHSRAGNNKRIRAKPRKNVFWSNDHSSGPVNPDAIWFMNPYFPLIVFSSLLVSLFGCRYQNVNSTSPVGSLKTKTPAVSETPEKQLSSTLEFNCENASVERPAVVFESGLGDDLSVWNDVTELLSKNFTTLTYSRAGYGESPASDSARDALHVADELRDLLAATPTAPPYILVGHSLGGLFVQVFARKYPDLVAGIVLIEAPIPELDPSLTGEEPAPELGLLAVLAPASLRMEYELRPQSYQQLLNLPPLKDIPIAVVYGEKTIEQAEKNDGVESTTKIFAEFKAGQERLAKQSKNSMIFKSSVSGHYVHIDEPECVVKAIEYVRAQSLQQTR